MDIYNHPQIRQTLPPASFYAQHQLLQCQASFPHINLTSLKPPQAHKKPQNKDIEGEDFKESGLLKQSKKITKELSDTPAKVSNKKPRTRRSLWKPHEDEKLLKLVAKYGQKWTEIGRKIGGRSCKQVRDRYLNNLRPNINTKPFSKEEDDKLISLYQNLGTKWKKIADQMPGRTESQVKNRFHIFLKDTIPNIITKDAKKSSDTSPISLLSNSTFETIEQGESEDLGEQTNFVAQVQKARKTSFATLQKEFFKEAAFGEDYYSETEGLELFEEWKRGDEIKDFLSHYERVHGSMPQMQLEDDNIAEIL